MRTDKIIPTTLDFMDSHCIKVCEKFLKRGLPFNQAKVHLLIEIDGDKKDNFEEDYLRIGEILLNPGKIFDSM